jgi:hypothetical protein
MADPEMLRNMVRVAMTRWDVAGTVQFNHYPSIINNAQRFNNKERRCLEEAFRTSSK